MKYIQKRQRFENSAGTCTYDPVEGRAESYGWWPFVRRVGGITIFNNYVYSPTTTRHQANVRKIMRHLGNTVQIHISTRSHLDNLQSCINELEEQIICLRRQILKRGSRKAKNRERRADVRIIINNIRYIKVAMRREEEQTAA